MNRQVYQHGQPGKKYGVYNCAKKEFQLGIREDSPMLAEARLHYLIGDGAKNKVYEIKEVK